MTQQELLNRFEYRDGKLFYRRSVGSIKAGAEAGSTNRDGYRRVLINRKAFAIHRLIFIMHHGTCPQFLDHIDNDQSNNRIENLRPATSSENNLNRGKHCRNTSGYKGVTWVESCKKYSSRLAINHKRLFLGYFDDPKEAHEAYCRAAKEHAPEFTRTE